MADNDPSSVQQFDLPSPSPLCSSFPADNWEHGDIESIQNLRLTADMLLGSTIDDVLAVLLQPRCPDNTKIMSTSHLMVDQPWDSARTMNVDRYRARHPKLCRLICPVHFSTHFALLDLDCRNERDMWTIRYFDSRGAPPPALLNMANTWLEKLFGQSSSQISVEIMVGHAKHNDDI